MESLSSRNLLIAGTSSGVGKHTIACGVIRLLKNGGKFPVPFKAISVERFPEWAAKSITPSIQIQAISAGLEPKFSMNPIRVIFSPYETTEPNLYLNGVLQSKCVLRLEDREQMAGYILQALNEVKRYGDVVVAEGTGGLSDWVGSAIGTLIFEYLNPKIILVVDTLNGGAIASAIGTLEIIPEQWRDRIAAIIFNNLNCTLAEEPMITWSQTLFRLFGIKLVGCIPNLDDISSLSEDHFPLEPRERIENDLNLISSILEASIGKVLLNEISQLA
jgi:adenosylcobyric acid synthase